MPYPNEHACRLNPPDKYKRFVRMDRDHNGKKYSAIIGFLPDDGGSEDQAYRYHKDVWTEAAARSHCQEKKGTFEPAEKEEGAGAKEPPSVQAQEYRLAYHIKAASLKEHRATVELLREGEWKHEDAPKGILKVPLSLMQEFIQNFQDKVCGEKLPLDYGHEPDDKAAPGWITGMRVSGNGTSSIFATLDITDPEARDNIKNGSLCYISPQLFLGWEDPESGKVYNVIRSAALTNYPLIKNMRKIVANFEEVTKEVKEMKTEEELKGLEEKLDVRDTELSKKETGFAERETKLTEGEETLEKEKGELEAAKLEQDKQTGPFYGLSKEDAVALADKAKAGDQKAQDVLTKYATGEIFRLSKAELKETLKEVGIDVELSDLSEFDATERKRVEQLSERVDKLEKEKDTATANFKETVDKLSEVTRERRKEKVEAKLEELIRKEEIKPAGVDTLRGILMADKSSDSIELEERDSSGKVTGKSKVSMGEAVLKFLQLSPRGVKLGSEGVVTKRTAVDLAEGLKKLVGMSQAEFNKLEPEVQESLLKKIEGFKD